MNTKIQNIIIFDFMRTLYDPEKEVLIDGAKELLDFLKEIGCRMYLVSRKEGQRRDLMDELHIAQYFEQIYLVEGKQESMEEIKKNHRHEKLWVIGDRVRGEIAAGNRVGAITVWFKNGMFKDEEPTHEDERPDFTIASFEEFLKLI